MSNRWQAAAGGQFETPFLASGSQVSVSVDTDGQASLYFIAGTSDYAPERMIGVNAVPTQIVKWEDGVFTYTLPSDGYVIVKSDLNTSISVAYGTSANAQAFYPSFTTVAKTATSTLTLDELKAGYITVNSASATNQTTPTAAAIIAAWNSMAIGDAFDVTITNLNGTGIPTLVGGSGVTIVGAATVAVNASGLFQVRRSGAAAIEIRRKA